MTDTMFHSISTPEFTPDTIQHLKDVRQQSLEKAEKAMQAHQLWMNRATQWDDLIRRAESHAERPDQSWQAQAEIGTDGTRVLPAVESESP